MTSIITPAPIRSSGRHVAPRSRRPSLFERVRPASVGPVILSLSVVLAVSRLMAHDVSTHVLVPLVVGVILADVVTALALRLRITVALAVALGCAISLWGVLVVVEPSLFNPASSHFVHAGGFSRQLRAAGRALANDGTPLPPLDGVILILGTVGGVAAAFTRGIWSSLRSRHATGPRGPISPCLAPSLSIFVYSTLVSAEHGRVPAFVSYFLGVLIFVAVADRAATPPFAPLVTAGSVGAAGRTARRSRVVVSAVVGALLVSGVVIAAGTGLSSMRLSVFHSNARQASSRSAPIHGVPPNAVTGLSLVDNLQATELTESNVVVFHALSPVITYWQVGTLSTFNGTEWLPTLDVTGALNGSAGTISSLGSHALPAPTPTQSYPVEVTITNFFSRLLPAPPGTLAVHALPGAAAIASEGVLAPTSSQPGTVYGLTVGIPTGILANAPQLPANDPRLAPYLALPTQPAVVDRLAHEAVGNATTPAAKAQALVNWFRSGRFRYTLTPPATGGSDPLVQFLTVTKAGFCQQFAGAYGVLARAVGLPTRLVAGFTAGQAGPNHSFTVTGADAHVWPQVYLGPDVGWVSLGTSKAKSPPTTTTTAAPRSVPTTTPVTTHHSGRAHHPGARHSAGVGWWVWALIGLVFLLAAVAAVLWLVRRRRAVREAALLPDERVVNDWEWALGELQRNGLSRHAEETPGEYASRVQSAEPTLAQPVEADAVAQLAALVELACYTPRSCTPGQVDEAHRLASVIVTTNRSHRRRTVTTSQSG
jgi:transglutaminase-like putative cysteine protease